jgi:hypothetical protein
MSTVGIDTHKATLAVCAIDELGTAIDERVFCTDGESTMFAPGTAGGLLETPRRAGPAH